MKAQSSINCGELVEKGNICLLGCADGNIVAFDLAKGGKSLYGYGADPRGGAINCLRLTHDYKSLITAGDSGVVLKISHSLTSSANEDFKQAEFPDENKVPLSLPFETIQDKEISLIEQF